MYVQTHVDGFPSLDAWLVVSCGTSWLGTLNISPFPVSRISPFTSNHTLCFRSASTTTPPPRPHPFLRHANYLYWIYEGPLGLHLHALHCQELKEDKV